jgi:large subunit ribosomal protein L25
MTEVEIECLPKDIPQNIEADISDLAIGDTLRLENITISDNLALVGDLEMLIASIVAPAKQEEEEEIIDSEDETDESTGDVEADADSSSEENNESASE